MKNTVKHGLIWLWLMTKRLYKKPTFLVLLLLIPALVLGYGTVAQQDSGVVRIALATHDRESALAQNAMDKLADSKVIFFYRCDTPQQAQKMVNTGQADAAWIFMDDLEYRVAEFIRRPLYKNAFVQIIERQNSVPLTLTREMLSGVLFECYSPMFYLQYIRQNCPELSEVSDAELMTYYDNFSLNGKLFSFTMMDGTDAEQLIEEANYLTFPVRGMLALVVMLCGLAGAMYDMKDRRLGTFGWVSARRRPLVRFASIAVCVANVAMAMLIALSLFGVTVHWSRELLLLLLYILCVTAFSLLAGRICGNEKLLGMCMPVMVVVMLAICPVLLDSGRFYRLALLFPPTYYVNGVYNDTALMQMLLHSGICLVLYWLLGKLLRRAEQA